MQSECYGFLSSNSCRGRGGSGGQSCRCLLEEKKNKATIWSTRAQPHADTDVFFQSKHSFISIASRNNVNIEQDCRFQYAFDRSLDLGVSFEI